MSAEVHAAWEAISHAANVGQGDELIDEVTGEHPTLTGQIGKAFAIGVMRHVLRDPTWKPYDGFGDAFLCNKSLAQPTHPDHDGRWSCSFVVGAEQMARQHYL